MKRIVLGPRFLAAAQTASGRSVIALVEVDWFPRLTDDQIVTNARAAMNGEPAPYPNPNFIEVELIRGE